VYILYFGNINVIFTSSSTSGVMHCTLRSAHVLK